MTKVMQVADSSIRCAFIFAILRMNQALGHNSKVFSYPHLRFVVAVIDLLIILQITQEIDLMFEFCTMT